MCCGFEPWRMYTRTIYQQPGFAAVSVQSNAHVQPQLCMFCLSCQDSVSEGKALVYRRQIQLQSVGALGARQAFRNIIERDGVPGLYKGFLPNALKNLPNKGTVVPNWFQSQSILCCFWST